MPAAKQLPAPVPALMPEAIESAVESPGELVSDDRDNIGPDDTVLLVVENDANFARFLVDMAHENQMKAVVAARGAAAIMLAHEIAPHAITLDINLGDIDGWRVLDRLKDDLATRHVPVYVITTDEERGRGLRMGAIGVLTKPLRNKEVLDEAFGRIRRALLPGPRQALVVGPDSSQRDAVRELIGGEDVQVVDTEDMAGALTELTSRPIDLLIVAWDGADWKPLDFVDEVREIPTLADLPILLYSTITHSKKEEIQLKRLAQSSVLRDVRSPERLFDAVSLFLHRPADLMTDARRAILSDLHQAGSVLAGKKVLVVDDDIRNIFAMTSILEPNQMQVLSAETGREAIDLLQKEPDIDAVLMDIMMPDMDGYDTMRAIRRLSKFRALPIIALTAKAMKGDREKCLEAGASDYISKPVDTRQLLGLLRLWLHR